MDHLSRVSVLLVRHSLGTLRRVQEQVGNVMTLISVLLSAGIIDGLFFLSRDREVSIRLTPDLPVGLAMKRRSTDKGSQVGYPLPMRCFRVWAGAKTDIRN